MRTTLLVLLLFTAACRHGHAPVHRAAAPSCRQLSVATVLTMDYTKRGATELAAVSPCRDRRFSLDGGAVITDSQGRLQLPATIKEIHLVAPSPVTAVYHAALASRLYNGGYYLHGIRHLLAVLGLGKSIAGYETIRSYFCTRWRALAGKGAHWDRLMVSLGGVVRRINGQYIYTSLSHGVGLTLPANPILLARTIPQPGQGPLSLVTLSMIVSGTKQELVLLFGRGTDAQTLRHTLRLTSIVLNPTAKKGILSGRLGRRSLLLAHGQVGAVTVLLALLSEKRLPPGALADVAGSLRSLLPPDPCGEATPQ